MSLVVSVTFLLSHSSALSSLLLSLYLSLPLPSPLCLCLCLSLSLPACLPRSLAPSLPRSLAPSLPRSLAPSLPPSLPPSLQVAHLSCSMTPPSRVMALKAFRNAKKKRKAMTALQTGFVQSRGIT